MKNNYLTRLKGPHLFLTLVLIILGGVMLGLSVRGYKDYSQRDIEAQDISSNASMQVTPLELQAMFELTREAADGEYEIVAQKNLFSPEREAWKPPPREEEEVVDTRPARAPRVNPRDFKLYGITSFREEKKALVYYQQSSETNRHSLLREGESASFGQDENQTYQVVSIDQESVSIQVGSETFEVSLYGHERQVRQRPEVHGASFVIGGKAGDSGMEPRLPHEGEPADVSGEGQVPPGPPPRTSGSEQRPGEEGPETSAEVDESHPGGLPDLLRRMRDAANESDSPGSQARSPSSADEMEAKVEQGTMRRIETPFGPVYRPVE